MTELAAKPILDYAGPRSHGKVRLPAKSVLRLQHHDDGVSVLETLSGKGEAVAGLAFAGFILLYLACLIVPGVIWAMHAQNHVMQRLGPYLLLAGVWVLEAALSLVVIQRTWRRTALSVRDGRVVLEMSSPFGSRRWEWPCDAGAEIRVISTGVGPDSEPLAEVQVRPAGEVTARLFTDHGERELTRVAGELSRCVGMMREIEKEMGAA